MVLTHTSRNKQTVASCKVAKNNCIRVYTNFVFAHWAKGPDVTVINTHFHMFSPLRMVPVLRDFNLTKTTL